MPLFYHLVTLGCQMNKSDSERLSTILSGMGLLPTEEPEAASVIILNSCSVRQSAEDRIFGLAREFARLKTRNPELILAVTGCMPGRDRDGRLRAKLPHVDLFFPTKDMVRLPQLLSSIRPAFRRMEDLHADYLALMPTYKEQFQAFVTIQTGCNHFCTYCVVPFARGLEVNRKLADIIAEIRARVNDGCSEITLLGQIVNHYIAPDAAHFSPKNPYTKNHFAKLLWEINQLPGIERVHFTAPHPLYMDDEAIDALTLPKQLNFLHLPVQSGNDEILKKMNRRHSREFYIDLLKKIRTKKPEIAVGTDIIVGFCGETEAAFNDTVDLYKQCDFDISYTAQYSQRTHTVAAKAFTDDIPKAEKKRRWEVLQKLMEETVLRKNQAYVGKSVSVLVDTAENGFVQGNSKEMKRVRFVGNASLVGHIVPVEIYKAGEWVLYGRAVS